MRTRIICMYQPKPVILVNIHIYSYGTQMQDNDSSVLCVGVRSPLMKLLHPFRKINSGFMHEIWGRNVNISL